MVVRSSQRGSLAACTVIDIHSFKELNISQSAFSAYLWGYQGYKEIINLRLGNRYGFQISNGIVGIGWMARNG